jgi:hypothetical protein
MNASRRIDPSIGHLQHRTQGNDSRGLGANRHHNSPGTFNHLNFWDGWYTYYPDWVKCSHAAGGNLRPGVENEGFTGERLNSQQVDNLGMYLQWREEEYGKSQQHYVGNGNERVWLDRDEPEGAYAHIAVAYPPNPRYHHYDYIFDDEYAIAEAQMGSSRREGKVPGVFVKDRETGITYLLNEDMVLTPMSTHEVGGIAMYLGFTKPGENIFTPHEWSHELIEACPLYGDKLPRGYPNSERVPATEGGGYGGWAQED